MIKVPKLVFAMAWCLMAAILWVGCGDDDDDTSTGPQNQSPVIQAITANPDTFVAYEYTTITVIASDADGDNLSYTWNPRQSWMTPIPSGGNALSLTNCCEITTPTVGVVVAVVSDGRGGEARDSVEVCVVPEDR